jgi:CDP-diacylglycerol--glycerol-3-phosphate 3-phosphatidyltransferase
VNLPNRITIGRLGLAICVFVLLEIWCPGRDGFAWYATFALFVITVATDGLDGYLARARNEITPFGRIADPLVDKIAITGTLVITMHLTETARLVPSWLVILVLGREFVVSGLRGFLEGRGVVFAARWEGKTKLVVQAVFCGTVLFYPGHFWNWVWWVARVGLWVTAAVTVWSAVAYLRRAAEILRTSGEV